jgi:hypothetical protein
MRSPLSDYLAEVTRDSSVTRLVPVRRGETAELTVRPPGT